MEDNKGCYAIMLTKDVACFCAFIAWLMDYDAWWQLILAAIVPVVVLWIAGMF